MSKNQTLNINNYNLPTVDVMGRVTFSIDRNGFMKTPDYVLSLASKNKLGTLQAVNKRMSVKFNDIGEISFKIYRYINGKKNHLYERVDESMYIYTPHTNYYRITSCTVQSENTLNEYKDCVAQQLQSNLLNKHLDTFIINMGVPGSVEYETNVDDIRRVKFYNKNDPERSLMHLVLEKAPEWTFDDDVEEDLADLERSFEVDYQDIYSFLTQDVATAFDCLFFFDTINNKIRAYKTSTCEKDTNIHISHKNLASNFSIQVSSDEIKTYLKLSGADDVTVREINMGYEGIYNLDYYFSCLEDGTPKFVTQGLYDAYIAWKSKWNANLQPYSKNLESYQEKQVEVSNLKYYGDRDGTLKTVKDILAIRTDEYIKDDIDEYLDGFSENGLNDLIKVIDNQMNIYAKLDSYGTPKYQTDENDEEVLDENGNPIPTNEKYIEYYLPLVEMKEILDAELVQRQKQIAAYSSPEHEMQIANSEMKKIQGIIDMNSNFTQDQLNELSTFIKEDELSDSNYVITDAMTEEERQSMLNDFLKFAEKELVKKSQPTYQFSATIANLFSLPEFSNYAKEFQAGCYINVSINDNYILKVRVLSFDFDFDNKSNFTITFGNVMHCKEKGILSDVTEAIALAQKTASSVSFNASNWSNGVTTASELSQKINDGLLSSGCVLSDGTKSEFIIDERGIFVNTGDTHPNPNDSVFVGGGRILFSEDDWTTVSTAIGRVEINGKSTFGVIAKAVLAGYIEGGEIVSANINNGNGTFSVDKDGKMIASSATVTGEINAESGRIGSENYHFTIMASEEDYKEHYAAIYSGEKSTFDSTASGVYIGTNGISLGANSPFKVDDEGKLIANKAEITGRINAESGRIGNDKNYFTIEANDESNYAAIYSGNKSTFNNTSEGVYIGTNGISLGSNNLFNVTSKGVLTAQSGYIGGLEFNDSRIKSSNGNFRVDSDGNVTARSITLTANSGSTFGGISYSSSGTSGNFNSNFSATYNFNLSGGARSDFNTIVAEEISANKISANQIETGEINGKDVIWQGFNYVTSVTPNYGDGSPYVTSISVKSRYLLTLCYAEPI